MMTPLLSARLIPISRPVQAADSSRTAGGLKRRSGERGVVFIWVLVGLFVIAVLLVAAVQPASIIAQRENEKELIFRGEAYTEAIRQYQAEHGGTFPTELKQLIQRGPKQQRYIRKLYRNPFAPDGKWILLGVGTTTVKTGEDGKPIYTSSNTPGQNPTAPTNPQQPAQQNATNTGTSAGTASGTGAPGQGGAVSMVLPFRIGAQEGQPIVGVFCNKDLKSFQTYRNQSRYNQWYFSPLVIPPPAPIGGPRPAQGTNPPPPGSSVPK